MKLNLDYERLAESFPLVSTFTSLVKAGIAAAGHVTANDVKMAIWPGSTVIEAQIAPQNGTDAAAVFAFLNGTLCNSTAESLKSFAALQSLTTGGVFDCVLHSMELVDPPFAPQEYNRAWIAFWSITVLPPFDKDGAWRLLKMVNDPDSRLSKLLPQTLGRIPGLQYRGLQKPNLAIHEADETRLPPPEDKAVGFALPDPYDEQARLEEEMRRLKRDQAAAALRIEQKSNAEMLAASEALKAARQAKVMIKQADEKFQKAARAHASALRASNRTKGPDIVPFEVLSDPLLGPESPYPWRDQMPPPRYMLNLAQESKPIKLQAKAVKRSTSLLHRRALVSA